jgi:hypothetical protein
MEDFAEISREKKHKRLGPIRAKKNQLGPVFLAFSAVAGV